MAGLARICRLYGRIEVHDGKGGKQLWVWDYVKEEPVIAQDMPTGSERWKASEKAKWGQIKEAMEQKAAAELACKAVNHG